MNISIRNLLDTKNPSCWIYSRGGIIPHLTMDNYSKVLSNNSVVWHIPFSTVYEKPGYDVIESFGKGFREFCSLDNDKVLVLNTNDSSHSKQDLFRYNEEKAISIWAPGGRRKVTPEEYMKFMETFNFDICIPPSDSIPDGNGKKRCQKSCDRTVRFLDRCLQIKRERKLDIPIIGTIEGGDSIPYREKCAKEVFARNPDAYIFGGLDIIGEKWMDVIKAISNHLNDEKLRIMLGIFNPLEVITAVKLGVLVFDSVICYNVTERGCALTFPYRNTIMNKNISEAIPEKRLKQEEKEIKEKEIQPYHKDLSKFEINLRNREYFDDVSSLVVGCECYCCMHHSRAYLHHLLVTKEMLAEVLLMMHNVHHWMGFFTALGEHKNSDKLNELENIIKQSLL